MIIGYLFTLAYIILFAGLIISAFLSRKKIASAVSGRIDARSLAVALLIIAFFVAFALKFVNPVEQLYFDENIYQGMALNILHNGNALWCQYGTANLNTPCQVNLIYHDPAEISFYLAIAFLLFGVGIGTAFGLQLAIGAISIFLVFVLASLMFGKKTGIASAAVFALLPELFIWSRTQAVPNLPLMMFTALAFLAYYIYRSQKSEKTMALFLSALGIAIYMRIEAVLLVPIFLLLYIVDNFGLHGVKKGISGIFSSKSWASVILLILFIILIVPELYYIKYETVGGLDYGSGSICNITNSTTFSIANFQCNSVANVNFFFGAYNQVSYYPAYFSPITTIIAIIGFLLMALYSGSKNGRYAALLLGLWILVFHLFYDFFYAGSVTFGVDVRFMLIIYPAIAIFAGFGIARISDIVQSGAQNLERRMKGHKKSAYFSWIVYIVLLAALAVYPFVAALGTTTIPYASMPQEQTPLAATNFIYQNYNLVPTDCLVFTFTPDVWYGLNRSASQVGYFNSGDYNFTKFESRFSCFVFDWGYWCNTQSYQDSTCSSDINGYNTTVIARTASPGGGNFTIYRLNSYKP